MKKFLLLGFLGSFSLGISQLPANYYNGTDGLSGYALKTKLSQIATGGHKDQGYGTGNSGLWFAYKTTDMDTYYENDNTILLMYSENPAPNTPGISNDPYNYKHGQSNAGGNQCGSTNQNNEGFCYNREHSIPKSFFGGQTATPMASDAHFIVPSDYYINSQRGDLNYGEVGNASVTFKNGTKIGPSITPGFTGTVFEPINEFKGDFARMHLYFITRYENLLPSFAALNKPNSPFNGTKDQGFETWYIKMLLRWAIQDPLSQKEIDRNNAVQKFQGNRNPFIDHPEWVQAIFGSLMSTDNLSFSKNFKIYPNPAKGGTAITVQGDNLKKFDKAWIYNLVGQRVQEINQPFKNGNSIQLNNLPKGIYILKTGELNTKFIVD
ncbi:endonuclease [Chryseobacterium sp. T1]